MSSSPLRLGLVGCGRIAERGYVPAARDLAEVDLVAVADPDAGRAEALAAELGGVPRFAGAAEMLAAAGLDALLVATPAADHLWSATLAAEAGLPCLVEKPPADSLAAALALADLDPVPAIGFNRRFLQGQDLTGDVPGEGWLEMDLELRFRRRSWDAHASRDEALLDAGTHLIDLATHLSRSSPIAVRAASLAPERAELEMELSRGRARLRCATSGRYAERVEIRDRAGRPLASSALGGLRSRLAALRGSPQPLVVSLRRQLHAFAIAARDGESGDLADARDGAIAMAVVEAARSSAELGGAEVTVARFGPGRAAPIEGAA
jgi:predicted dehydrogenase